MYRHPIYASLAVVEGKSESSPLIRLDKCMDRQALHAEMLTLVHPIIGERMTFRAPIPEDMKQLMKQLSEESE